MERIFCQICNAQLKLNNGDFVFSNNTKCCNNHIQNNIDLDDLLLQKKLENYKCKEHNKNKTIHCFNCDEDICLYGLNKLHKGHKTEYINYLNLDCRKLFNYKYKIKKEKKI